MITPINDMKKSSFQMSPSKPWHPSLLSPTRSLLKHRRVLRTVGVPVPFSSCPFPCSASYGCLIGTVENAFSHSRTKFGESHHPMAKLRELPLGPFQVSSEKH